MMRLEGLGRGLALLAMGGIGAGIARWLDIPAGVIIGSLMASAFYRLAGGDPEPWRGRFGRMGRLLFGAVIGAAFGPDMLEPLEGALLPMVIVTVVIIGLGLGLGWALGRFTPLDTASALISGVPGGLPVMVAIADESDADATVVAAIHFSRLTTILFLMPILIPALTKTHPAEAAIVPLAEPVGSLRTAVTLAGGLAVGLLTLRLGIPSGDLIGPIVVVGGVNILGAGPGPLANGFRDVAILFIGTAVGSQTSLVSLRLLRRVALPAVILIGVLIGCGLALGWGLSEVTTLDLASALLSSVPGGASTMPAVAHDLGGDMRLVAALHLIRQMVIFVVLPALLSHLLRRGHSEQADVFASGMPERSRDKKA